MGQQSSGEEMQSELAHGSVECVLGVDGVTLRKETAILQGTLRESG